MAQDHAILIERLTKSFKDVTVLKGIGLAVERGTMAALLGPNGAGKTTTIRILSTLLAPDGGTAVVNGYNVVTQPHQVRENIGPTGQYAAVDEYLTGFENLDMIGRLYHLGRKNSKRRAEGLLEQFDLSAASRRPVKNYSGGMRRRLDLALSLMATPPLFFSTSRRPGWTPEAV